MVDWVAQVVAGAVDPVALVGGMSGVQLCGLPEPELFRRVGQQFTGVRFCRAHFLHFIFIFT